MIDTRVKVPDYATDVRDWNELSSRAAKFKLLLCEIELQPSVEIRPALRLCTFPISSFLSLFCHLQRVENVLIKFGLSRSQPFVSTGLPSSLRSSRMEVLQVFPFPASS